MTNGFCELTDVEMLETNGGSAAGVVLIVVGIIVIACLIAGAIVFKDYVVTPVNRVNETVSGVKEKLG